MRQKIESYGRKILLCLIFAFLALTVTKPASATSAWATSSTTITVGWEDVYAGYMMDPYWGYYQIERSVDNVNWGVIAYTNGDGSYTQYYYDSGLIPGGTYYYRVYIYDAQSALNGSYYTDVAAAATPGPPAVPTDLGANPASSSQINLSWSASGGSDAYAIQRKTGSGGTYAPLATVTPGSTTTYSDTGLSPATTYYYKISAGNGYGYSSYSGEVSATTANGIPIAPSGLGATATSSTTVNLSWTDNSSNETGFKIERKTGSGGSYTQIATVGAGVASYPDSGLTAGTTYYYRVRANNSYGDSSYSNEANATPVSPPAAPSGLGAAAISSTQVNLNWADNSNNETGFKIERKTGSGGTYSPIGTASANAVTYNDSGLSPATTYYYRISATNIGGDSAYSNQAIATTTPGNNVTTGTVTYKYDPSGNLIETNAGGVVTSLNYDVRGRKTSMADPDMGTWTYVYNAAGDLVKQTDAKAQLTTMVYDKLGRMTSRTEADLVSTWTYDSCTKGVGKLCSATASNNYSRTNVYDSLGRISQVTTNIDINYVINYAYDTSGRLSTTTYPTSYIGATATRFVAKNVYVTTYGYLQKVTDNAGSVTYWLATAMDARGHVTAETLNSGLSTARAYDNMGQMTGNTVSNGGSPVQNLTFVYDTIGNLTQRTDGVQNITENFYFDNLNRLIASDGAGLTSHSYSYDAIGNITYKSDVGSYTYPSTSQPQPHAVSSIAGTVRGITNPTFSYDPNGSMLTGLGRTFTYTSFNMPSTITAPNGLAAGTATYSYVYNAEHERVKNDIVTTATPGTDTTIYLHPGGAGQLLYEKETKTSGVSEYKNYINAGGLLIGVYITRTDSTTEVRYFHTDHLGSITLVTSASGAPLDRMSYDAWGKRRYPNGTDDTANALSSSATDRGFTGHEMMDELGLVHMNGRIYDPLLGRFVTADMTVQFPDDLQSYNRYSYVLNNPLIYIDPTGYSLFGFLKHVVHAVGHIIGFVQKVGIKALHLVPGQRLIDNLILRNKVLYTLGQIAAAALTPECGGCGAAAYTEYYTYLRTGSISTAIKAGVVTYATDLAFHAAGGNIFARAAIGCVSSQLGGGSCKGGALSAAIPALVDEKIGNFRDFYQDVVFKAVVGGVAAKLGGDKFENGAVTAAFAAMFAGKIGNSKYTDTFASAQDLNTDLGQNGLRSGFRALNVTFFRYFEFEFTSDGWLGDSTLQLGHEQQFMTNSSGQMFNYGHYPEGLISDPNFPGNIDKYRFTPRQSISDDTIQLIHDQKFPGFEPGTYSLPLHNCQDFGAALRSMGTCH